MLCLNKVKLILLLIKNIIFLFRYGTKSNFELYKQDYVKLYVNTIQKVIEENDKSRSYLSSSPTNGIKTIEEGYVAENPYSALYGDSKYNLDLTMTFTK